MLKYLFTFLTVVISCVANAQSHPKGIIYSAEINVGDRKAYLLYNHEGHRILPDTVDWAWSNAADWIFVKDNEQSLAKAYSYEGRYLGIDSIENTLIVSANSGLVGIQRNGKWGFYDFEGKAKVAHLYDDANPFDNGRAVVRKKNRLIYIDTLGNETTADDLSTKTYRFEYADIALGMSAFENPDFEITGAKNKGLKEKNGRMLVLPLYEELLSLKPAFQCVTVKKGGKYGVVAFGNKMVIPIVYKQVLILNDYLF